MRPSLVERFWAKVKISEPTSCWIWIAAHNSEGRGHIRVGDDTRLATHVAWFLTYGVWPRDLGLLALHHCDNPSCVNVLDVEHHVWLGTHQENQIDMCEKGRHHYGGLTIEAVTKIRQLWSLGSHTQPMLSDQFGVTSAAISLIIQNKRWIGV